MEDVVVGIMSRVTLSKTRICSGKGEVIADVRTLFIDDFINI